MIRDCDCLMPPLVRSFDQIFCSGNTIHIAHLCMTVQFHTFLRAGIHSRTAEVSNLFNSGNRTDSKFTVKSVDCRNTFKFQESPFLHRFCYLRHLFITKKHLDHNGICKIRHRKNQNRFFVTDLPCLYILTVDNDFAHLTCYGFQIDRITLKISSINHVRIAVPAEAAMEIPTRTFLFKSFLLLV